MDSDDENDRRRRDKFRRERSDYSDRRERDTRRRDDWNDRRRRDTRDLRDWNRRDYQDRGRRDRYSPPPRDLSPPSKRMRRDWDSGGGYGNYNMPYGGGGNQGYGGHPQSHGWGGGGGGGGMQHMQQGPHHGNQAPRGGMDHDHGRGTPHGPHLMSFKNFLASQDDMIDDTEAVRKYNEYKVEFKRTQLSEFFLAHKEEEWFRSKYYPDEADKLKAEGLTAVRRRLLVFLELYEEGWMDKLRLQSDRTDDISRLLDAAVIKMEGGTSLDLKVLDQQFLSPRRRMTSETLSLAHSPRGKLEIKKEKEEIKEEVKEEKGASAAKEDVKQEPEDKIPDETGEIVSPKKEKGAETQEDEEKDAKTNGDEKPKGGSEKRGKKRKRHHDSDYENDSGSSSSGSSSSGSESESDNEPTPPGQGMDDDVLPSDKLEEDKEAEKARKEAEEDDGELKEGDKEGEEEEEQPAPRPLHKTYSLFIRNVAPMITKAEIISLCKRYNGFMRVALAEPQPERNFQRHGWVTFDRSVNIKEICWNLSSIRLRDCELSPVVNRDLANRIRGVSGITAHKKIIRADLKLAARLVQQLDKQLRLFCPDEEARFAREEAERKKREEKRKEEEKKKREEEKKDEDDGEKKEEGLQESSAEEKEPERIIIPAKYKFNPVLENITDYLVEEVSAEEDALMGAKPEEEGEESSGEVMFLRDEELNKVLDRLLVYLRIVHSVDYYNTSQYHIEDEMPNRCGIMHTRGHNPPSRLTHKDLTNWISNFETKLSNLLNAASDVVDEELVKLGRKDPELEVEKFVKANTQEIGKDKWLCPLSGKKFKGPEFVRKHIFNKHSDKVDDVRKEVAFFNNYLKDPNRPQLPEPQAQKPPGGGDRPNQGDMQGGGGGGSGMGYQQQQQQFGSHMMGYGGQQQGGNFGSNRGFNQGPQFGHQQQQGSFQRGGGVYGGGFNRPRNRFTKRGDQLSSRTDPRHIVNYRDLDAPNDDDFF
ncbi:serrate RNA effector molecule homolog B-like isoform X2 [Acanthaster planci]|uniref:Serrate RNA effector molecule homolog B-like isoform X2 n=1 Tax=Acanthaster planci TaxID=133434 RepID=A0A8B7Y6I7_ACAPL|nr:serrate RNA effector molecule homolog B-like isoform X2 [Acanthaster planci]